jgi:ABC-type lipoprotein export system ATPase subunit
MTDKTNRITIEKHIDLLLDKYKLRYYYNRYVFASIFSTLLKESFSWALILFSIIVKEDPTKLSYLAGILLAILAINIPVDRFYIKERTFFIEKIKLANIMYYNDRLMNLSKKDLLYFDLVEYFDLLRYLDHNFEEYFVNIKCKYDIPIRFLTLIVIAVTKNYYILIPLFLIFYTIVKTLNNKKVIVEEPYINKIFPYEEKVRNYLINSKNYLINDELNINYLNTKFYQFNNLGTTINEINNKLDMKINFFLLLFILAAIGSKMKTLNPYDFFHYFIIIYDVEYISDKTQEYYRNKAHYNKMEERINYLNSFKPDYNKPTRKNIKIDTITITKVFNKEPKIENKSKLVFKKGEPTLITGESGSGKTSLFYILKGIIKPENIDININNNELHSDLLSEINSQTYLTLPNHKNLYSDNLYNLISNHQVNPNIKLITFSVKASQFNSSSFTNNNVNNDYIELEKLSGGERVRLLIARLVYIIKSKGYNILLFDEIDENLNKKMAIEICQTLKNIFNDKIILYITHNENVKQLFYYTYNVEEGVINNTNL